MSPQSKERLKRLRITFFGDHGTAPRELDLFAGTTFATRSRIVRARHAIGGAAASNNRRDRLRARTEKRRVERAGKGPGMFANVQAPQPPGKIQDEFIRLVGKAKAPPRDLASVLAALFAGGKSGRRYRARCPRVGVSPGVVSGMSRPVFIQDKAV